MELEVNNAFPISQTAFLKGLDRISSNRMKLDTILGLPLFLSELSVIIGLGLLVAFGEGGRKDGGRSFLPLQHFVCFPPSVPC